MEGWREGGEEGEPLAVPIQPGLCLQPGALVLLPTACIPFSDFINGLKSPGSLLLSPVSSCAEEAGPNCVTAASVQPGASMIIASQRPWQ